MTSPYRAVLGDAFDALHPRLRAYFDTIPAGSVGRGEGVFATAGTPWPWLWGLMAPLEREGVAAARFGRDIPFTVENRPGRRDVVHARRVFLFTAGAFTMVDAIAAVRGRRLVDDLGTTRRFRASFAATVVDGGLVLDSTRFGVRLGRLRVALPNAIAPRVRLSERWDEALERQQVDVAISLPLVGRVYGYAGWFRYRIEREDG